MTPEEKRLFYDGAAARPRALDPDWTCREDEYMRRKYPYLYEPPIQDAWVPQRGPFSFEANAALDARLKALEARLGAAEKRETELPLWSEALESLPDRQKRLLGQLLATAATPIDIEAELRVLDKTLKHVTEPDTALCIRTVCGQLLHRVQNRNDLIVAIYTAMMPKGGESDTKVDAVSAKGR